MGKTTKTDNHDPKAKLDLRRYFLGKYHADGQAEVMDCCQSEGFLWEQLRKEFQIKSYWGLDLKPKPGRLKIDSSRVLEQSGWTQNVIDVDAYGSPWKHWLAMLPNITRPTTIFLTWGLVVMRGGTNLGADSRRILGLRHLKIPPSISLGLSRIILPYYLGKALDACTILESVEAVSTGNARYFGLRLVPIKKSGVDSARNAANPKPRQRR